MHRKGRKGRKGKSECAGKQAGIEQCLALPSNSTSFSFHRELSDENQTLFVGFLCAFAVNICF
jgi:hypothetical protein